LQEDGTIQYQFGAAAALTKGSSGTPAAAGLRGRRNMTDALKE
jgi:hypothetical protein